MAIDYNQFTPHVVLLVFIVCLLEYGFQSLWNKKYFKNGITCFFIKRKASVNGYQLPLKILERQFTGLGVTIIPSILFKKLDDTSYAFREKYWFPSIYLPVMRGLIELKPESGEVVFRGKLNYAPLFLFIIILPIIFKYTFPEEKSWLFFFVLFFISALIQYIRYAYVCIRSQQIISHDIKSID